MFPLSYERPTARPKLRWLLRLSGIFFAAYTVLLVYLSLTAAPPSPQAASDKLLHFVAYGGFAALLAAAKPRWPLWRIFILGAALGILLEAGQGLMGNGRTPSIGDQIANMGGLLMALLGWIVLVRLFHFLMRGKAS